jgi:hypothetical protein
MKNYPLVAAFISASSLVACTQTVGEYQVERKTVNGLPVVVATSERESSAKVDAIDYGNRSIALTGEDGKTEIFTVAPQVRNFSQIKKGDTVKIGRISKIVASIRKTTEEPVTEITRNVMTAEPGHKPGIVATHRAQVEAVVQSIDYKTGDLKLKTAAGDEVGLTVSKQIPHLDRVKVGDQVVFNTTETIYIIVQ